MTRLRTIRRRLRSDRSGIVGPTIAALATSLLAAGGLALDVGLYYMGNRDLRSATEAAALAAAMNPLDAHSRAINFLAKNGYPASVLKSVEVGYYCASMWRATGNRFVTGAAAAAGALGYRMRFGSPPGATAGGS
jgi:Flp pilus assembly protein TadG